METTEKRKFARARLNLPVGINVRDLGNRFVEGNITNIGAGGLCVLLDMHLNVNSIISLTFEFQEGFRFEGVPCKVLRSIGSGDSFVSALQFVEPGKEMLGKLDSYVKSLIFFKRTQMFKYFTEEECGYMRKVSAERSFKAGQVIFKEGAEGDGVYIIQSGKVSVIKGHGTSAEETLATLGETDFFGEMALLDSSKRSASVVASTDAVCFLISRDNFEKVLVRNKALANELLWVFVRTLSRRLREAGEKMADNFFTKSKKS